MKAFLRISTIGFSALLLAGWLRPTASPVAAHENTVVPRADNEASPLRTKEASDDEKSQLRVAKRHVMRLRMRLNETKEPVALVEQPLLAFGDAARGNSHGTMWTFGASGRPDAFLELWQVSQNPGIWYQSFIRTSDRHLLMETPDGRRWLPPADKIARISLDGAEPPASSRSARMRQLRSLAKRFTAHEAGDADHLRTELRLLAQPIHRYDDRDGSLHDGAAFIFAHGTNPEAILLIEALGATLDAARWHYSVFPTTSADLFMELDGKEVWKRPGAPGIVGRPTDDYWLFSLPTEANTTDDQE